LLPLLFVGAPAAQAGLLPSAALTLEHGWTGGPYGTAPPAASIEPDGMVHLYGAMTTNGTDPVAFTLPPDFRPESNVYVPVDMCSGANGRLDITPDGQVTVQTAGAWSNAQCLTSLDGVSFFPWQYEQWRPSGSVYLPISPQYGWTGGPFGTDVPHAQLFDGVVQFAGAMATSGTTQLAFTLPPGWRPASNVFIPVDLCGGTNGRLAIKPDGEVFVQAEGAWLNAQCFTSLEGASFVVGYDPNSPPPPPPPGVSVTSLSLQNGWTGGPYGTAAPQAQQLDYVVHFQGAMATNGTNNVAFQLPPGWRPVYNVFLKVDLCAGHNGQLEIFTNGYAEVYPEGGFSVWSRAQCFTSLDGVSFGPT